MTIPGFTADAITSRSGLQFDSTAALEATSANATVEPQACVKLGPCKVCVTARIFPPKACVKFSCLGANKSFCIP
jgi:hypothetical protein